MLVIKQELGDFLALAAKYNGYDVKLSGQISGTLEGSSFPMEIHKLLPELGKHHDLKWHIADKKLFVSMASSFEERVVLLHGIELDVVTQAIKETDIDPNDITIPDH